MPLFFFLYSASSPSNQPFCYSPHSGHPDRTAFFLALPIFHVPQGSSRACADDPFVCLFFLSRFSFSANCRIIVWVSISTFNPSSRSPTPSSSNPPFPWLHFTYENFTNFSIHSDFLTLMSAEPTHYYFALYGNCSGCGPRQPTGSRTEKGSNGRNLLHGARSIVRSLSRRVASGLAQKGRIILLSFRRRVKMRRPTRRRAIRVYPQQSIR